VTKGCIFLAAMLLLFSTAANACIAEWLTLEQRFDKASSVFIAHITKAEVTQAPPTTFGETIEATFRPGEIFKGDVPASRTLTGVTYSNGNCSIPFLPGLDYLVFLYGNSNRFMLPYGGGPIGKDPDSVLAQLRKLKSQPKG